MNIFADNGIVTVPVIAVIAFLITEAIKLAGLDSKWCPVVSGAIGGILGVVALYIMPEFPVKDILTAIAVGIVSGWGASGFYDTVFDPLKKRGQHLESGTGQDPDPEATPDAISYDEILDEFKK